MPTRRNRATPVQVTPLQGLNWGKLRRALTLEYVGGTLFLWAYVGGLILHWARLGLFGRGELVGMLVQVVVVLAGMAALSGLILLVIGRCLACAVPSTSRTRSLAIASVCCLFGSLAAGVILFLLALTTNWFMYRDNESLVFVVATVLPLLLIAWHCLWMLFLRGVAVWLGDSSLARNCIIYLGVSILLPVVVVFIGRVVVGMLAESGDVVGISVLLLIVMWGGGFVLLAWQRRLVVHVRETIPNTDV